MTVWLALIDTGGAVLRAALWPSLILVLARLFRTELALLIGRIRTVSVFTPGGGLTATAAARRVAALLGPGAALSPSDPADAPGTRVVWLGAGHPSGAEHQGPTALRAGGFDVRHAATGAEALRLLGCGDVLVLAGEGTGEAAGDTGLAAAARRAAATVVRYSPPP